MLTNINLDQLRLLATKEPEIKRLCAPNVPVYLLQMELERYNVSLNPSYYEQFNKIRKTIYRGKHS